MLSLYTLTQIGCMSTDFSVHHFWSIGSLVFLKAVPFCEFWWTSIPWAIMAWKYYQSPQSLCFHWCLSGLILRNSPETKSPCNKSQNNSKIEARTWTWILTRDGLVFFYQAEVRVKWTKLLVPHFLILLKVSVKGHFNRAMGFIMLKDNSHKPNTCTA